MHAHHVVVGGPLVRFGASSLLPRCKLPKWLDKATMPTSVSSVARMFSVTRPAVGICFALLAFGCGGGSRLPSGPTPSGSTSGPTNSVLTGPYTISVVVTDESGRPIAGASPDACCVAGVTYSHARVPDVPLTDANGRLQMTGISGGTLPWFRVFKDGYVQQCAAPPVTVQGDLAIDLRWSQRLTSRQPRRQAQAYGPCPGRS
jgi:hypothetical protein